MMILEKDTREEELVASFHRTMWYLHAFGLEGEFQTKSNPEYKRRKEDDANAFLHFIIF